MYRPAGWVMLLVGVVVAYAGYLGYEHYPASLSAIPYRDELLPFLVQKWSEQRELYAPLFESKFALFVRSHPMETMGWYGGMGLFLLLNPKYRNAGWELCLRVLWYGLLIPILFFLGLFVAQWGIDVFHFFGGGESSVGLVNNMRTNFIGTFLKWLAAVLIGVPVMLFGLVVGLVIHAAVYVVPPLYILFVLFVIPSIVFVILRLLVRLPVLTYHYLHYLTVPHPMEKVIIKHDKMRMKRGGKVDHDAFVEEMLRANYDPEREGIPGWWKSENWARRLKNAMALRKRVKIERQVADEYVKDLRESNRQQR